MLLNHANLLLSFDLLFVFFFPRFYRDGDDVGIELCDNCVVGDVIGCGILSSRYEVFFTLNGRILPLPSQFAQIDLSIEYYFTVGFHSIGAEIELNFGAQPFVFSQLPQAMRIRNDLLVGRIGDNCQQLTQTFVKYMGNEVENIQASGKITSKGEVKFQKRKEKQKYNLKFDHLMMICMLCFVCFVVDLSLSFSSCLLL